MVREPSGTKSNWKFTVEAKKDPWEGSNHQRSNHHCGKLEPKYKVVIKDGEDETKY